MKVIDIVKPEPKTEKGLFNRWMDNMRAEAAIAYGKRIPVKYIGKLPDDCRGQGRTICVVQGEHSWFNHSMDSFVIGAHSNLPTGYTEPTDV